MKRRGLLSTTGLVLITLVIGLTLHEWEGAVPLDGKPPPAGPELVMEGVRAHSFNNAGTLHYRLDALALSRYEEGPPRTLLSVPSLALHDGETVWHVQALRGHVEGDNELIRLQGEVRATRRGEPPLSLDTEAVLYRPAEDIIRVPGDVLIRHQGGTTRAGALEGHLPDGRLELRQRVESRYAPAS